MELITRKEAQALGLKRYFTGKQCKRGHLAERMVSTMTCVMCKNKREKDIYWRDPEAAIKKTKRWQDNNRERHNARAVQYQMERKKSDPLFALKNNIKVMLCTTIKRKGFRKSSKSSQILGCSWTEFMVHIERQFLKGMSWDNRHLWHIDHIIPLATAETEDDVIALNHHTNLRPIWASDNMEKRDKLLFLI